MRNFELHLKIPKEVMFYLLSLEWKKLRHYRTFQVLSILYLIAFPALFLLGKAMKNSVNNVSGEVGGAASSMIQDPYMFPFIWNSLGYMGNWLNFFTLGIIAIVLVTNEYNYRTLRQSIINGLTRWQFFLGKLQIMAAIALAATLYYFILGMVFGYMNTDYVVQSKVWQNADLIPRYFLQCMGYMSFAFFLGWLFRRLAMGVVVYFIYSIFLELAFRWAIIGLVKPTNVVQYLPLNVMEDLVPLYIPVNIAGNMKVVENFQKEFGMSFFLSPESAVLATLFYLALFFALALWRLKASDL
jgi:ABC-type transport system involved in multi-copper enzyme maturation permease subunit